MALQPACGQRVESSSGAKVVSKETVNGFKNAYDHNYDKDMDARSR